MWLFSWWLVRHCGLPYNGVTVFTVTYPLTARVVWASQMTSQPVSSIFLFLTVLEDLANSRPDHSLMLSSHLFFCLPCLLCLFIVPCEMVLARPDELETCPCRFSACVLTMVRRSLCGPIACWIWARTSSLVTWSLYGMHLAVTPRLHGSYSYLQLCYVGP